MTRQTRRALLASAAALAGGGGGCTQLRHAFEGSNDTPGADRDGPPPTDSPTPDATPDSLTLEAVEPPLASEGSEPQTVTVYPESMALALRRAARIDGTYRGHGYAYVYAPEPFWTRYDTVRITGPDAGSSTGTYEMEADGGVRYELLVGADRLDGDEPAPSVSGLESDRRELALAAIRNEGPRVFPETELGEWVRTEWFGNRWEHEGTVYRGKEVQQTDAAFFSQQVWATVELREARADPQVVFELRAPDDAVRDALDPVFEEWSKDESTAGMADPPEPVVEYLRDVDLLATHTAVADPSLE